MCIRDRSSSSFLDRREIQIRREALHATAGATAIALHATPDATLGATVNATADATVNGAMRLSTRLGAETAKKLNTLIRRCTKDDTAFRAWVRDIDQMLTTDTYTVADITSVCADDEKNHIQTWHGFQTFMRNARQRRFSFNAATPGTRPSAEPVMEGNPVTAPGLDDATIAAISARRNDSRFGNPWWKWCVTQAQTARVRPWDFAALHVNDTWPIEDSQ